MSPWAYLGLAIAAEVVATSALKASEGFSRFWPSALVVLGYGLSFYLLSLTLNFELNVLNIHFFIEVRIS